MSTAVITPDPNQYRLPTNVKAAHYDIIIKTDLENLTFDGIVTASLHINAETSTIVLHSSELELRKATVYSDVLKAEQIVTLSSDKTQERVVYQLTDTLPAGSKAELKIVYAGKLTGNLTGYYKSTREHEGKTKHYALTQFEPTAARRAFPCWDEPLLKATYTVTMISRADTVNLSNMPAVSEVIIERGVNVPIDFIDILASTENEEWKITRFDTTPLMSSYLVAFANGHFEFLETSVVMPLSGKTVPLRIYTTGDVIHQAQFALDVKAAVLPLYEKVFDVEYPLPKLDTLVASDFDAGAMENWGLITGRTSAFLLDPKRADLEAKKRVVSVQSHEVAHMWFGNITTMEWWNYLYLNEGFATLMGEVIIPDKVYPEWKVNSAFINHHFSRALGLDAQPSSHPIEVDCPDANQIKQIFDALSYSKAASVLRMLSNYVGEEKFLKGVSLYLKKKLFANSVTRDLWEGISTATGMDIVQLMENWITKIGFPVLTVTENAQGITVRQDRFLEMGIADAEDNKTIWNVPLSLLSTKDGKSSVDMTAILQERERTISLDTSQPFKLNAGTVGVYRVLYTPERLVLIAKEAARENSVFSLDDRLGLLQDAMALTKAGLAKLSSALTLIDSWKGETEYLVWQGIGNSLSELISVWWEYPKIIDKLNAFRRTLFVPLVNKLGYEYSDSDARDTSLLRTFAVEQASAAGDEGVVNELKSRFKHFVATGDDTKIPADLQRTVFITAVREGGREEYDAIVKSYDKPKTPTECLSAIAAMGASRDAEVLQETLKIVTDKARDQDVIYFFQAMGGRSEGRRPLTTYFQDNYDALYQRFAATSFSFSYLVTFSSNYYASNEDLKMIEKFYEDKDTSKYNLALGNALDSIRSRIAYVSRSTDELLTWESLHHQ